MIFFARAVMPVVILSGLMGYPLLSYPSDHVRPCANSLIVISADEPIKHQSVCDAAEDALAFFARMDLELMHPLIIEVAPNLPDWMSETAVGCYEEDEQKIHVLTFSAFEKKEAWFGVSIDRLMYRSLVAHEVSHAVARCNFTVSDPTIHAEEYVAYVAMFATMSPLLRTRILAANPSSSFDSESEINEVTYAFNPMRFGIEAYRHYLKEEHGDAFLLKILSGKALTSSVLDHP